MERRDYTKVFDVSRPSRTGPDPTSRPVIVGHHPMMTDPMVNKAPIHANPDAGIDATPHHAKVIQVTNEVRQHIAQAQPPSPDELAAEAAAEEKKTTMPPATVAPGLQSMAPMPVAPQTMPALPVQQSAPVPPTPAPEPDLTQIQHVPVSHMSVSSSGRLRSVGLWLIVGIFLIIFGLYLAVDAGFIQTSVNLPFHIFSREG
jgi:hypothetical protein